MAVHVERLASRVSDNQIYWLESDGDVLVVDPIDAEQVIDHIRARAPRRVRIVTTHGHMDHQGGNAAIVDALGIEVIGPADEPDFPVACDRGLRDGDTVELGDVRFEVLHVPGHTRGHIALYVPGWLVSGDVLFEAGVGTCRFGGDPPTLFETVTRKLATLPDETVFLPGHDYAQKNLAFQLATGAAGPDVAALSEGAASATATSPQPRTLGWERSNSVFLRVHDPEVQARAAALHPAAFAEHADRACAAFCAFRALRDTFPAWSRS